MSRTALFQEELELDLLRVKEQELRIRQKEYADLPKKLAMEQKERDCTMPPLAEIEDRIRLNAFHETATRGQVKNILRGQTKDILLLFLLLVATGALIWWGLKLMQG